MRRILVNVATRKVVKVCDNQSQSVFAYMRLSEKTREKIGCFNLLTARVIGDTIHATDLGTHHFGAKWAKV